MTDVRILELEAIGFVWNVGYDGNTNARNDELWNQRLDELKEYRKKYGNCNVPNRYSANKSLGKWVRNQRHYYKLKENGKSSSMTDERILELEAIGFVWKVGFDGLTADELWNQRLEELKEYREKHGNCYVPQRYSANKSLGQWVINQRHYYKLKENGKKSTMTDERILELEAIGFVWKARRGPKRVKSTNVAKGQKNSRKKSTSNTTTNNKKRQRQQSQNPSTEEESEKIKRRRIAKEWLKIWRAKPGSSIRDLL